MQDLNKIKALHQIDDEVVEVVWKKTIVQIEIIRIAIMIEHVEKRRLLKILRLCLRMTEKDQKILRQSLRVTKHDTIQQMK